ncbi:N-acetylmuramoyl-L-alanine amidase [Phenylobacterium sp.]|jgi:N-acetylmuramoyl-L-alanine amidase|uniref:N-acetylmuramoyl-L-alanine amidase n=1 Tax=Phenylobacterium sp. TaxID=1871053 RepID=UPI002E35A428|nr:N-acetylmuramoyl-L-alanine amidase [Phenylobacterium sp.]HEX4709021.1 N-acetylmuramoyl-L-alanine amidase [Phenylobacterium sp.]
MNLIEAPSPNFDARTAPPDILVLHYTGMRGGEAALERLRDPEAEVSAHYMVEEDGRVFRLVPEERRAWHAGVSYWKGERNINGVSIGIEIVNPGHEFGYRPFAEPQVAAVIELIGDIRSRWTIGDDRIVGHSDVAPGRKEDPGELFPWKRLAQAGHGLWVEAPPAPGKPLAEGAQGVEVFALQAGFTRLGYDLPPSGQFDAATAAVVTAFQRHWRQEQVDGIADGATRARLIALLRLAG